MTVETGLMESDTKLASDAAGWLESDGSTNDIVLAVSIHEGIPRFVIKKILYLKGVVFGGIDDPGGNCAILAVLPVLYGKQPKEIQNKKERRDREDRGGAYSEQSTICAYTLAYVGYKNLVILLLEPTISSIDFHHLFRKFHFARTQ